MDGDADIADITPDAAQAEINATRDDAGEPTGTAAIATTAPLWTG
jgi:hypothetical protein